MKTCAAFTEIVSQAAQTLHDKCENRDVAPPVYPTAASALSAACRHLSVPSPWPASIGTDDRGSCAGMCRHFSCDRRRLGGAAMKSQMPSNCAGRVLLPSGSIQDAGCQTGAPWDWQSTSARQKPAPEVSRIPAKGQRDLGSQMKGSWREGDTFSERASPSAAEEGPPSRSDQPAGAYFLASSSCTPGSASSFSSFSSACRRVKHRKLCTLQRQGMCES